MYNDVIGGGSNGSFRGSPGPDSDIYGNLVSHCWDDGLEVEGGSRNVRIWDNYITQCHDDDRQRGGLHRPALHLAQRRRTQPVAARRRRRATS